MFRSGFKRMDLDEDMRFMMGMQKLSRRGEARTDVIISERSSIDAGIIERGGSGFGKTA